MITDIVKPINGVSFVSPETELNDMIFTSVGSPANFGTSRKDYTIDHPDYRRYVLTNLSNGITCIDSNNMPVPVKLKRDLSSMQAVNRIQELTGSSCGVATGVFIVEYFAITGTDRVHSEQLVNYYTDSFGNGYSDNVVQEIRDQIPGMINKRTGILSGNIRIVTFVDSDTLMNNHYVYVDGPNLVLVYGKVVMDLIHPRSTAALDARTDDEIVDSGQDNVILLSITNNDATTTNHIKVGGEVHCIVSNPSKDTPAGCKLVIKRRGIIVTDTTIAPEDYVDHGIFPTREECLTNGDIRASLDLSRLDTDRMKMIHDKDMLILKTENELKSMTSKHEFETRSLELKIRHLELDSLRTERTAELTLLGKEDDLNFNMIKNAAVITDKLNKMLIDNSIGISNANKARVESNAKQTVAGLSLLKTIIG